MFDKFCQWYHNFKIWYCKEEVDFFQKEISRLEESKKAEYVKTEEELKMYKAYFYKDSAEIKRLNDEKAAMLIVDPAKIVKTEEIIIDELGRPARKKILTIGGEKLNPELSKILKQEVIYIKKTMWWGLMQNTLTETARKTMFENSKDFNDVLGGKYLLYAIDILRKITERIEE